MERPVKKKPGILLEGKRYDTSSITRDYDETFFTEEGIVKLKAALDQKPALPEVPADTRWAAPQVRPSKIICIGLNYADHARESNMEPPKEPVVFFKSTSALVGPNDDLVIPKNSVKTDWEVELAVIVGKKASYVDEKDAANYIAGYALHNDYSEREFQLERGGQWVKVKAVIPLRLWAPGSLLLMRSAIPTTCAYGCR